MIYIFGLLVLIIATLLAYKYAYLNDKDNDFIPDELEVFADEIAEELKSRVDNVKAEMCDVKDAAKNLVEQVGDVAEAAAGAKRKGRAKK
jgi:hypothetical protein